jgi:molybdopterin-binding protein
MNFLHGRVVSMSEREGLADVSGSILNTRTPEPMLEEGEEVLLCIRTEKVLINPSPSQADNTIKSQLKRIVFRGVDFEVTCEFNDSEIRSVVSATLWDHSLKEGDGVNVGFMSSDVIVFPRREEKDVVRYSVEAV